MREVAALAAAVSVFAGSDGTQIEKSEDSDCDPAVWTRYYAHDIYPGDSFDGDFLVSSVPGGEVTVFQDRKKPAIKNPLVVRCGSRIFNFLGIFRDGQKTVIPAERAKYVRLSLPDGVVKILPVADVVSDSVASGVEVVERTVREAPFEAAKHPGYMDGAQLFGVSDS